MRTFAPVCTVIIGGCAPASAAIANPVRTATTAAIAIRDVFQRKLRPPLTVVGAQTAPARRRPTQRGTAGGARTDAAVIQRMIRTCGRKAATANQNGSLNGTGLPAASTW